MHCGNSALRRATELMVSELDRFESLLSDLLEISRFDAGAAVLEPQPEDLDVLVARAVQDEAYPYEINYFRNADRLTASLGRLDQLWRDVKIGRAHV